MRFCIVVSLYPVWTDVDAIYQVLKQAGEIRGNSTNSPPTPPTAEHPPSGAAPSSARASSHPCSSSTSGKAHHRIPVDLGTYVGTPEILSYAVADQVHTQNEATLVSLFTLEPLEMICRETSVKRLNSFVKICHLFRSLL